MATVVQPSGGLEKKLLEYNARRNADIPLTIGSILGGTTAGMSGGGAPAAIQVSRQLMPGPKPEPPGQAMAELGMKKDIADAMAKYNKDISTAKLSAMEKMNKSDELFKAILGASANAFGVYGSSLTGALNNYNNARVEMNKNWGGALADVVKSQSAANAAQIQGAFERIRDSMAGNPGQPDQDVTQLFLSTLNDLQTKGDDAGAEALIMKLEAAAPAFGIQSFNGWMDAAKRAGDPYAGPATELSHQIGQTMEGNNGALLEAFHADQEAVRRGLKLGVPNMDKALEMAEKFMDKFGGLTDPSQVAAAIDEVMKGQPGGAVPLDTYENLLADLDQDNLPPASNLAEARKRLIADPEFQAWMKDNGLTDPGLALKELRRIIGEKSHAQAQQTRETIKARRGGNVGAETGGSPTALVVGPTGAQGAAVGGVAGPDVPEMGWVQDEAGNMWIFGEDGKLREPTPEDDEELGKMLGGDMSKLDTVVRPASDFAAMKKLSDEASLKETAAMNQKAASTIDLPEVKPGIGMGAAEVGFGLAHPRRTGEAVSAGIKKLFARPPRTLEPKEPEDIEDFDNLS